MSAPKLGPKKPFHIAQTQSPFLMPLYHFFYRQNPETPHPAKDANNVTIATDDESTPKSKVVNCLASVSCIKTQT
tara:strand:- start:42 stop:266 length:225 start_codon:yes stop_codon:yes gene_type:complete